LLPLTSSAVGLAIFRLCVFSLVWATK
jgi:hypothetical protein